MFVINCKLVLNFNGSTFLSKMYWRNYFFKVNLIIDF